MNEFSRVLDIGRNQVLDLLEPIVNPSADAVECCTGTTDYGTSGPRILMDFDGESKASGFFIVGFQNCVEVGALSFGNELLGFPFVDMVQKCYVDRFLMVVGFLLVNASVDFGIPQVVLEGATDVSIPVENTTA